MPPRLPRRPGEGPRPLPVTVLGEARAPGGQRRPAPAGDREDPPPRLVRAAAVLQEAERVAARLRVRLGSDRARPPPTPIERALKLLAARERTARELDQALARARVPAAERATALARMRELGYIDDAATATARARRLVERGESPRMVRQRLRAQGVDAGVAIAAAGAAAEGASDDDLAARAVRRRLRGRAPRDAREKQRLLRALVQKGHRPSAVAKALELEWDGDDLVDADE